MDQIDREIQEMLAVKPSPDFLARIRTEVAKQPVRTFPWKWAVAAAAVMAIMVVGSRQAKVNHRQSTVASQQSLVDSRQPQVAGQRSIVDQPAAHTPQTTPAPRIVARSEGAPQGVEPPMPEVIISPEDVRAFNQFVALLNQPRLAMSFDVTPTPEALAEISALTISPIVIEPLDTPASHN